MPTDPLPQTESMTKLETRVEPMVLNMGPHHPSMHGVLRLIVTLDGEDVVDCEPVIGYLHRGMEKIAESRTNIMYVPYRSEERRVGKEC